MKATKIKMKAGCYYSQSLLEIDEIYIEGCTNPGYYKKAVLYDYLKKTPGGIYVDIYPYPQLLPELSIKNEKYVRSTPNNYTRDNLLNLPRT